MVASTGGAFPVPEEETERLADLYDYDILDTAPEPTYDDLTRLAAKVCDRPMAAITFIDEHRQWVKAEVGGGAQTSHRSESFCARAITDPEQIYVVEDATQHPEFEENPYVLEEPELRFYAGAPIQSYRGHGLGTICVLDTEPGTLDDDERRALASLSRTITLQLELRRRSQQLRRANEDMERIAAALGDDGRDALNEMEAGLRLRPEESPEQLEAARSAARRMDSMISSLEEYARVAGERDPMTSFALSEALEDAKDQLDLQGSKTKVRIEGHGLPVVFAERQQISLLLRKLLSLLLEPGESAGAVHVTGHRAGDRWRIQLTGDPDAPGAPSPEELERALDTEASGAGQRGRRLGLALCRRIVERHGGEIGVEAGEDPGPNVWFTLPGPEGDG